MKNLFFTGLVILLPVVLTIIIIGFIINILTSPFTNTTAAIFDYYGIFNRPFLFMSGHQVLMISSKIADLIGLVIIIYFVGFFGRLFFLKYVGQAGEFFIHRTPLINKIYKSIQEVVHTLLAPKPDEAILLE